ncbi:glucosidase, partial [bacterium]|nr:glucosidase [bacterium]
PPLVSWAAWQVYMLDLGRSGVADRAFLEAMYRTSALVAGWWLNRKDTSGNGIFGGGFLGMDNIGVFNRDQPLPTGGSLEQADGTAWIAMLTLHMLEMVAELARIDPGYQDMLPRYLFDFSAIARVLEDGIAGVNLWDEASGFYFDVVREPDGEGFPLKVFSVSGLVPLFAAIALPKAGGEDLSGLDAQLQHFKRRSPQFLRQLQSRSETGDGSHLLYSVVFGERLKQILRRVLDPEQFLSDHGVRALSRQHLSQPYTLDVGGRTFTVPYWPNVSHDRMFGGNSNWRGPVWFPVNFLLIQAIHAYARFYGDTLTVELPTGSGHLATLAEVADDLARRLATIFVRDEHGRRAVFGANPYFQGDPHWRDYLPFHEYFDGEDGSGVGASHQTGWTATVALLLQYGGALRFAAPKQADPRGTGRPVTGQVAGANP